LGRARQGNISNADYDRLSVSGVPVKNSFEPFSGLSQYTCGTLVEYNYWEHDNGNERAFRTAFDNA